METLTSQTAQKMSYVLKYYRHSRGLSQIDLAQNAGLSFRNYQRIETGESLPRVDTLLRLSKELKLKPSTLLEIRHTEEIGIQPNREPEDTAIFDYLAQEVRSFTPNAKGPFWTPKYSLPESASGLARFAVQRNRAQIEAPLQKLLGVPDFQMDLDHHLVGIHPVDIWECLAHHGIEAAKSINIWKRKQEISLVEIFFHVLSHNPDKPFCIGLARLCPHKSPLDFWPTQTFIQTE